MLSGYYIVIRYFVLIVFNKIVFARNNVLYIECKKGTKTSTQTIVLFEYRGGEVMKLVDFGMLFFSSFITFMFLFFWQLNENLKIIKK